MLIARINPPAKRIIQTGPFETKEFTGDLMILRCEKLTVGTNEDIEIEVRFGNVKYERNLDGSQGKALFDKVYRMNVSLTQQEAAGWGTDDSVLYDIVAQKLGLSVTEKIEIDLPFNT
jgi:hypothetical protein